MSKIEQAAFRSFIEPYESIARGSGVELRTVVALAANWRLSALFDERGVLRRAPGNRDPVVAKRYLNDLKRRWARTDATMVEFR